MRPARISPLAALTVLAAGCVSGNKIRADGEVIAQDIARAKKSGAYRCAPRELAMAETETEFGEKRLDHGDYFGAKDHLKQAAGWAREAYRLSPKEKCVAGVVPRPVGGRRLDSDGDGSISRAECKDQDPRLRELIESADWNHDGRTTRQELTGELRLRAARR